MHRHTQSVLSIVMLIVCEYTISKNKSMRRLNMHRHTQSVLSIVMFVDFFFDLFVNPQI
jgi:hypothetical protein